MLDEELIELFHAVEGFIEHEMNKGNGFDWKTWLPSIVSILVFLLNTVYLVAIQPKIDRESKKKEVIRTASAEYLKYLAELVSFNSFEGVPTKVRQYSLQILLLVDGKEEENDIDKKSEKLFEAVQERKKLTKDADIKEWGEKFRDSVREMRHLLAKVC